MPAELFVDTSGWFPLVDPTDRSHSSIAQAMRDAVNSRRRIVTTNLVVAETHALIMRTIHRTAAAAFLREVMRAPNVVVSSSPELEASASTDWLDRLEDRDFSLADAVSFSVMKERRIREALALDHHFAVAGFSVIP